MSIRSRPSKKAKSGYTYQVYFPYLDSTGERRIYRRGGFKSRKEAQDHEVRKKKEIIDYGYLDVNDSLTVLDAFKEALELKKNKYAWATYIYYKNTYKAHIDPVIGKRMIKTIRYSELQSILDKYSYSTAKNIKKVMSLIWSFAIKQGVLHENFVKLTNLPEDDEEKTERIVSEEQIDAIVEEIQKPSKHSPNKSEIDWVNKNYAIAIRISQYTGLRLSETLALEKEDVNFDDDTISVNKRLQYHKLMKEEFHIVKKLKTKESVATIPLAEPLKEILQQWFEITPFNRIVTDADGWFLNPGAFTSRLKFVSNKLGIKFTYHYGRHYYSTTLANNGTRVEVTKALMRHGDIRTTLNVYTHVDQSTTRKAINTAFKKRKTDGKNNN